MSGTLPLFDHWPGDAATDGRVTVLNQALAEFSPREIGLLAAAALVVAMRDLGARRTTYSCEGGVVTVEILRDA